MLGFCGKLLGLRSEVVKAKELITWWGIIEESRVWKSLGLRGFFVYAEMIVVLAFENWPCCPCCRKHICHKYYDLLHKFSSGDLPHIWPCKKCGGNGIAGDW